MSPTHIIELTRAVSNIHISEDIPRTTISSRNKTFPLISRSKLAVVKSQSDQHRAGKGKGWGLLQEYKARTRDRLPSTVRTKKGARRHPPGRDPRPRTAGPKTLEKMTEALIWAIVEWGAINLRRYPRFLPISLKAALPEKGKLHAEQKMTAKERRLKNLDDDDPIEKFKRRSKNRPFLAEQPGPDATIVWAIWSECKAGLSSNIEPRIAKVFQVATEMVNNHLIDVMYLPHEDQNRAWVNFAGQVRRACQGRVAWPMRLTRGRFCQFIFALLDSCWFSHEHELAKIQYLKDEWEREKPKNNAKSRRRQADLKPIEGLGPLVTNMRAFLAASKAAGSPWILFFGRGY